MDIKVLHPRVLKQPEMVKMGGNYHLQHGIMAMIPVDKIDGLDPEPGNWSDEEGEYHDFAPGVDLSDTKPIEVIYDNGVFMMQDGNHRVKQAKLNGDSHIKAFVQADSMDTYNKLRGFNESVIRGLIREAVNEVVIDETYTGQKDLEKFTNDILKFMGERVIKERERNVWLEPESPEIRYLPLVATGKMDGEGYGELGDFIANTSIRINPRKLIQGNEGTKGELEYGRPTDKHRETFKISLKFTDKNLDDINEMFEKDDDVKAGDVYVRLFYMFYSTLLHELQHAYDAWRSKGKSFNSIRGKEFLDADKKKREVIAKLKASGEEITPEEREAIMNGHIAYQNLMHEINARYAQAVQRTRFIGIDWDDEVYKKNPWKDVYKSFTLEFDGWRNLSDKMKKKLIRRLAKHYQDSIENEHGKQLKENMNETIDKLDTAIPDIHEFAKGVASKLGFSITDFLDKGMYGYAFKLNNGNVMKITSDKNELIAANKLKGKKNKHIVDVYDSFKVKDKNVYVIIMEFVEQADEYVGAEDMLYSFFLAKNGLSGEYGTYSDFLEDLESGSVDDRDFDYMRKVMSTDPDWKYVLQYFNQMLEMRSELRKNGITTMDFGSNNIGRKNGVMALFDLGMGKYDENEY